MTSVAARLTSLFVPAVLLTALLAAGEVQATTGTLAYRCTLPVLGGSTFAIEQDTNAPGTVYLGRTFTPTLTTRAQVPADKTELMAKALKAEYVDGTITAAVRTAGAATPVLQQVPRTPVPDSGPLTLVATGRLAALAPSAAGSLVYLPGDLSITLRFYASASDTSPEEFEDMPCVMPQTSKTVDTVSFAKSPTKVTPAVAYAKATKKATATARVTATSGLVPAGRVTVVLLKGSTKLKTVAVTLSGGRAKAVFPRVRAKGSYKVVFTYAGSAQANRSTAVKTFVVR